MSGLELILPWLPAMMLLIGSSAFFSGSEAALFSLQSADRRTLAKSRTSGRLIDPLLANPERLLSAVLFWNLIINMAYFGIASIVGKRLEADGQPGFAIGFTVFSLLAIIFCSEMLPKSLAVKSPVFFAGIIARPLSLSIVLIGPILPALSIANRIAQRILWPRFQPEQELELDDIDRAIQYSAPDAAFADRERIMLRRLVSLTEIRVDEWMRPRSEYRMDRLPVRQTDIRRALDDCGYLFIGDASGNELEGIVALRWLRPSQMDDLQSAIEAPLIVPWSTTVANVFDALRENDLDVAAVVNEYGETVGILTIDDLLESILANGKPSLSVEPKVELGSEPMMPMRVSGSTSARELAKQLGTEPPTGRNVTVAGLIQTINRRIPRQGDECPWNDYLLKVVAEEEKGKVEIEITPLQASEGPE